MALTIPISVTPIPIDPVVTPILVISLQVLILFVDTLTILANPTMVPTLVISLLVLVHHLPLHPHLHHLVVALLVEVLLALSISIIDVLPTTVYMLVSYLHSLDPTHGTSYMPCHDALASLKVIPFPHNFLYSQVTTGYRNLSSTTS